MIMAVLGFVLAFVGIILLIGVFFSFVKVRSFSNCSESISGRAGNKYVHHGNNRRYYSIDISYTVDGNEYKRSVPISLTEYETLKEGDLFEVKYKPDKPKKIIRADSLNEKSAKSLRTLLIISASMTAIGIVLILIQLYIVRM